VGEVLSHRVVALVLQVGVFYLQVVAALPLLLVAAMKKQTHCIIFSISIPLLLAQQGPT